MTIALVLIAVLPCIAYFVYIVRKDRIEPEPVGKILYIMLLGALSCVPAGIIELIAESVFPFLAKEGSGQALSAFVVISPVEELCKIGILLLFAVKLKEFNEENDGIVYGSAAAIGFAMFENIFYVFDNGFGVGILRGVTAVPMHAFCGIIIGYYVGVSKFSDKSKSLSLLTRGFIIAYVVHALYDAFLFSQTALAAGSFVIAVGAIVIGRKLILKGSELSRIRWKDKEAVVDGIHNKVKKTYRIHKWKFVVGIIFGSITACIWLLGLGGAFALGKTDQFLELVVGLIIFTFIPALVSLIFFVFYYNDWKRVRASGKPHQNSIN